jgi:glucan 1,3-beta-glucosidase
MSATVHAHESRRPPTLWLRNSIISVYFLLAAGSLAAWWWVGRPIHLAAAGTDQLDCVSYTPPAEAREANGAVAVAQIEADLKVLATRTKCVRTYSVMGGLDRVPPIAKQLGLKVLLGVWISATPKDNEKEIARAIALAHDYHDVIHSIIVGNEVLLRHEQTAAALAPLLERVRNETQMPVTYADVWEFWLRNAELASSASYITIHILPYWEDDPVAIDQALAHVADIYNKVRERFPGKTIFIGETGWPSAGRPRKGAVPSRVNEARFIREFVDYANAHDIPYNIIEGYDQPWKRLLEGTVGGYWGVFDAAGAPKFPMNGPVENQPYWRSGMLAALACALVFAGAAFFWKPRPSVRALSFVALAGYSAGAVAAAQWFYLLQSNRNVSEWIATVCWTLFAWLTFGSVTFALIRWLDRGGILRSPADALAIVGSWGHGRAASRKVNRLLGLGRFVVLLGAAYTCAGLVFAPRYRDFPIELIALAVVALAALEFIRLVDRDPEESHKNAVEEALLATWIALASVVVTVSEGLQNYRALTWNALALLLAASVLVPFYIGTRKYERAQQQTDSGELEPVQN